MFHNDLAPDERQQAYLVDVGGGIRVVDLQTGEDWRWPDGHESSQAEDIDFVVRGKKLTDPEGATHRTGLNPITPP
ncbi:MAG: hypothetical protein ACFB6S_06655 [Geminicoccaceae bacterium]